MTAHLPHRVSCGALVHAGRILLVHRSPTKTWYPDVWDFPGGHLEAGESSGQALVRELREELGVEIVPPRGPVLLRIDSATLVLDVWRVDSWHGTVVNGAPAEHDALGWFTAHETRALHLADSRYRPLLELILAVGTPASTD